MNSTFWDKYKVFIFGLIGAIAIAVQTALNDAASDQQLRTYLYAAMMAALSFIATQWRGKNVSITGIVGTLAGVFVTMQTSGNFTWAQFVTSAVLAVLAAVAPPPKPSTYEHNVDIVEAKKIPPKPSEIVVDDTKVPLGNMQPAAPKDESLKH